MKTENPNINFLPAKTLDDLMNDVLSELLKRPFNIKTSRGDTSEILGVLLKLEDPRARLSRTETKGTVFSALGELLWYLSKTDKLDFIKYYISPYEEESEDGNTIYGAYGPRLFNNHGKHDQVNQIIALLREKPLSRRAVIQIFDSGDITDKRKEIPCTCTLQFIIRDSKLHLFTCMRSNDAFLGLPHDVFTFTMLQEIIARTLDVELGSYNHAVGSLHLYKKHKRRAIQFLKEGFQPTLINMPNMPKGNPWPSINSLLRIESKIRLDEKFNFSSLKLEPYWLDLIRLLWIYSLLKKNDCENVSEIQDNMQNSVYNTYINTKLEKKKRK